MIRREDFVASLMRKVIGPSWPSALFARRNLRHYRTAHGKNCRNEAVLPLQRRVTVLLPTLITAPRDHVPGLQCVSRLRLCSSTLNPPSASPRPSHRRSAAPNVCWCKRLTRNARQHKKRSNYSCSHSACSTSSTATLAVARPKLR